MKRIRQVIARMSRARQLLRDTTSKSIEVPTSAPTTRRPSSNIENNDVPGSIVLYDETHLGNPDQEIDLIFVHGAGGARVRSWEKNGICWPRDLLAGELETARIISWGYDLPKIDEEDLHRHSFSQIITELGEIMAADLAKVCESKSKRNVIFVAHGFGGLIVKDALSTAATSEVFASATALGQIYKRTIGVIFLGTPHIGTNKQSLGGVIAAATTMELPRVDPHLLQILRDSTEQAETQHDDWIMCSRDIHVVCIRELLPMPSGTMLTKAISSYTGLNVTTDDILGNHCDISRFGSRRDSGYFQLVGHITRIQRHTQLQDAEAKLARNREILDALRFDTRQQEDGNKDSFRATCSGILSAGESAGNPSPFYSWLQSPGQPIFWMSGSPGSGKSTVMKYAFHDRKTRQCLEQWAQKCELMTVGIFLFEGGRHVQRSFEGVVRGILFQVLDVRPDLISVCFPGFVTGPWPPPIPINSKINLTQAVYRLFTWEANNIRVCIFLDGLDEYRLPEPGEDNSDTLSSSRSQTTDESNSTMGPSRWVAESHAEVSRLILELGSQEHIKFCVSSRELPHFEEAFNNLPRLRVHHQSVNLISQYCADRLERVAPGLSVSQAPLCNQVARKSRGDILWARLVIDMLMEGSLKKLTTTLDSLPSHLDGSDGLYMRMIQNLRREHQKAACRIFQVVLRAQDPPSLITVAMAEEGYLAGAKALAVNPSLGELRALHDDVKPCTEQDVTDLCERMEERLAVCCAGLLETEAGTLNSSKRVVFMHLTAKELVLRRDVWDQIHLEPPNKVEVDLSLISGCVRHVKCFPVLLNPLRTGSRIDLHPELWLLVGNALTYAARIDTEIFDRGAYFGLLDELDRTCQHVWTAAVLEYVSTDANQTWSSEKLLAMSQQSWAGFEPMELGHAAVRKDFLSLAVQANLLNYVSEKLALYGEQERKAKVQELLSYATSPEGDTNATAGTLIPACAALTGHYAGFHHDLPDPRFLDLFFSHGATMTGKAGRTIWTKMLFTGQYYFSHQRSTGLNASGRPSNTVRRNRRRWVAAIMTALANGADANTEIEFNTRANAGENSSTEVQSAIQFVKDILDGVPEFAKQMVQIEALAMGVDMDGPENKTMNQSG